MLLIDDCGLSSVLGFTNVDSCSVGQVSVILLRFQMLWMSRLQRYVWSAWELRLACNPDVYVEW